jgi:hypothetical protein
MQVNGSQEPNQIPRISPLSIRDNRLRFMENNELPPEIRNVVENHQPGDVSIPGKKFKRINIFHQLKLLFRISLKVNLQGETILVNYKSIRNNTYAAIPAGSLKL